MRTNVPAPTDGAKQVSEKVAQRAGPSGADFSTLQAASPARGQPFLGIASNGARAAQLEKMRAGPGAAGDGAGPGQARYQSATRPSTPSHGKGLPADLRGGIESLSGLSMEHVTVHYNSRRPAQVQAHAFAQGSEIHLGPGQEEHLPHEAWHVVQQAQGRVAATMQMAGAAVNDNARLEHEADEMGARAMHARTSAVADLTIGPLLSPVGKPVLQRKAGMEVELDVPVYEKSKYRSSTYYTKGGKPSKPGEEGKEATLSEQQRESIDNFLFGKIQSPRALLTLSPQEGRRGYSVSTDHGYYQEVHRKLKTYVWERHLGPGENSVDQKNSNISNLEYATAAYYEDSPEDEELMKSAAVAVQEHAEATVMAAGSREQTRVPKLIDTLFTGVPMVAFNRLLGGDAEGVVLLNDAQRKANDAVLAYQTTVGIMPSEIPDLFRAEAKELSEFETKSSTEHAAEARVKARVIILNKSISCAESALNTVPDDFRESFGGPQQEQALLGWLALISQYLIASLLDGTNYRYDLNGGGPGVAKLGNSSSKNLVPYLSKVRLRSSQSVLPWSVRPYHVMKENPLLWEKLFDTLLNNCLGEKAALIRESGLVEVTGTIVNQANKVIPSSPGVLTTDARTWLQGVLTQSPEIGNIGPGTLLNVEEPIKKNSDGSIEEVDVVGEMAIPLEDRATKYKTRFLETKPKNASAILMVEWNRAKRRREASQRKWYLGGGVIDSSVSVSTFVSSGSPSTTTWLSDVESKLSRTEHEILAATANMEPAASSSGSNPEDFLPLDVSTSTLTAALPETWRESSVEYKASSLADSLAMEADDYLAEVEYRKIKEQIQCIQLLMTALDPEDELIVQTKIVPEWERTTLSNIFVFKNKWEKSLRKFANRVNDPSGLGS